LKRKGFMVCLVSELMLVAGIVLATFDFIVYESGICGVFRCLRAWFMMPVSTDMANLGVVLLIASAVGFAIGLPLVWRETTPSGTAG
jgi:predicted lysophospholipase L1 biosynthesis ABC-type transport system permease subunit